MSGSAGGNRILREDVESTIRNYYSDVLSTYLHYENHVITGSYNCSNKHDFGDIDLIVQVSPLSTKMDFVHFIKEIDDNIIIPFRSDKYNGKKYLNTGELITVLYPSLAGGVQIDNIFSYSKEETNFKNQFLSLPAIKQGLILGLIKCAVLENNNIVPDKWRGIPVNNQELEYNLSSSGLTLRLVTLGENYKTLHKTELYTITDWTVVQNILKDYDFSKSFEEILTQIQKTIKHPRSINRIKGIFKSMVSVKSGEVGTEKGLEKEKALLTISKL